jgi:hypothetical protein
MPVPQGIHPEADKSKKTKPPCGTSLEKLWRQDAVMGESRQKPVRYY